MACVIGTVFLFLSLVAAQGGRSSNGFVSSTHELATDAGLEMLRKGGNAADAAAAVQFALAVVQPQSLGLGGGCFLVMRKVTGENIALDGREEAPAQFHPNIFCADEDCFTNSSCTCEQGPLRHEDRILGGLSNGVPGAIAAMQRLVDDHGVLSFAEVMEPAIRLAADGFPMYTGMYNSINSSIVKLSRFNATAELFLSPNRTSPRVEVGELFINPDIAATLRLVAAQGADAFYRTGPLPEEIVNASRNGVNPDTGRFGLMSTSDLSGYKAVYREALVTTYRNYTFVGMPPPSSGGPAIAQIFNWMEGYNVSAMASNTSNSNSSQTERWTGKLVARWVDAQNAAFADRNMYVADPDFVDVPVAGLLDKEYNAKRRRSIASTYHAAPAPLKPGIPPGARSGLHAISPPQPESGTTHVSIIDKDGTMVALTTTIEAVWGSGVVVPNRGFLLNNEMTDFSATGIDEATGLPYANQPEGGKRLRRTALHGDNTTLGGKRSRSSMSPTLILNSRGQPVMATGAPGGSTIIAGVANVILQTVDLGVVFPTTDIGVQAVTNHSRVMSQNSATATAENDVPQQVLADAKAWGCNFSFSSGIALVQSVVIIHPEPDTGGELLFAGACDNKRQYQGEGVCKAAGACAGTSLADCDSSCSLRPASQRSDCQALCKESCNNNDTPAKNENPLPPWAIALICCLSVGLMIGVVCVLVRLHKKKEGVHEALPLIPTK